MRLELLWLRNLLRMHHEHNLQAGTWGIKGRDGEWIELDMGAEYSDSSLCDLTTDALGTPVPTFFGGRHEDP